MKTLNMLLIIIVMTFVEQSMAMKPRGGATSEPHLGVVGTKVCSGKAQLESTIACYASAQSGSDWAAKIKCDNPKEPIKIMGVGGVIGNLKVSAAVYKPTLESLKPEVCINITTSLLAEKTRSNDTIIPNPNEPLTLKIYMYSEDTETAIPFNSETIKIKIDKERLKETLTPKGLENYYSITITPPSGKNINKIRFSMLPTVSGDHFSVKELGR